LSAITYQLSVIGSNLFPIPYSLIKQSIHIALRVKHHQVVDLFADADVADGQV